MIMFTGLPLESRTSSSQPVLMACHTRQMTFESSRAMRSNQSMKPTPLGEINFSELATDPAVDYLFLVRRLA